MSAPSRGRVNQALGWSSVNRLTFLVIQFVCQTLVMRLLVPEQFGAVALATSFNAVAVFLAELGLTAAIIQANTISDRLLASAFWLNLGVSVVICGCLWFAAPLIADFYSDQTLVLLVRVSAVGFLFNLSAVPSAVLQRHMRFQLLTSMELGAGLLGLVVTMTIAFTTGSTVSLVVGPVSQVAVLTLSLWLTAQCGGALSSKPAKDDLIVLWRFGKNLTGANLLYLASKNIDTILLGRTVSFTQLAFYDRAYRIMMVPLMQLTAVVSRVMLADLASRRADMPALKHSWLHGINVSFVVGLPLGILGCGLGRYLVSTLYGSAWMGMVPVFVILSSSIPFQVVARNTGPLLQAMGRTDVELKTALKSCTVTILCLLGGLNWGIVGVSFGLLLASFVAMLIELGPSLAISGTTAWDLILSLRKTLVAGLAMGASILALRLADPTWPDWSLLVAGTVGGLLVFGIVLLAAGRMWRLG